MGVALVFRVLSSEIAGAKGNNATNRQCIMSKACLKAYGVAFLNVNRGNNVSLSSMSHLLGRFDSGPSDPPTVARNGLVDVNSKSEVTTYVPFAEKGHVLYVCNMAHLASKSLMNVLQPRLVVFVGPFFTRGQPTRAL